MHLNDQTPSRQSHLSNPNVQPSSATSAIQFTVDIGPAASESGNSITTRDLDDGEVPLSSVGILSSTPSPRQIPPPTYVPAVIENPMPTPFSAHDHVCSNSVPCRDFTATIRPIQTDTNNLAQSAMQLKFIEPAHLAYQEYTQKSTPHYGREACIPTATDPNDIRSQHTEITSFQDTEGSEAHISQSDLSLQLQVQNLQLNHKIRILW